MSIVHCRICKEPINKEKETDWINPVRNFYYHKSCYESWKNSEPKDDESWIGFIYDFISRDLKVPYDYWICEAQRKKFLKDNMTNKGIFFALKYFYEVQHHDWNKGHGGIGIVPYIYTESCTYWANKERINRGLLQQIEEQMKESHDRGAKTIRRKRKKKPIKPDFSAIAEMDDS